MVMGSPLKSLASGRVEDELYERRGGWTENLKTKPVRINGHRETKLEKRDRQMAKVVLYRVGWNRANSTPRAAACQFVV